jgi:hypothetical protein
LETFLNIYSCLFIFLIVSTQNVICESADFDDASSCNSFSIVFNYVYCTSNPCCTWNGQCASVSSTDDDGCITDQQQRKRRQTTIDDDDDDGSSEEVAVITDKNTDAVAAAEAQLASAVWW